MRLGNQLLVALDYGQQWLVLKPFPYYKHQRVNPTCYKINMTDTYSILLQLGLPKVSTVCK